MESEAAKAVGGFRPARRGALCLGFHKYPEAGVLPIPNRTRDLTHQRSLLHAEQNAPKRTVRDFRPHHRSRAPKCLCLDSARALLLLAAGGAARGPAEHSHLPVTSAEDRAVLLRLLRRQNHQKITFADDRQHLQRLERRGLNET